MKTTSLIRPRLVGVAWSCLVAFASAGCGEDGSTGEATSGGTTSGGTTSGGTTSGGTNSGGTTSGGTGTGGVSTGGGGLGGAETGGADTGDAGAGGAETGGTEAGGGETGGAGVAGTGGEGTGGTSGTTFTPVCGQTLAGEAAGKGVVCTNDDVQLCYKTCGPQSVGFKSETCTEGAYVEQSGCSFPTDSDYSCYSIPATLDPSCPATAPQSTQPCTVGECTPCNLDGGYLDSGGNAKTGYCVCTPAGTWSCASNTAWPCPGSPGCL